MIVKYKKYILSAVAASALIGCSREAVDSGKHGYLTAGIEQDMSVNVIKTKADVSADDPFTLNIYKGSELLNTISDHRTLLTEPLQLNCAKYRVTAQNRETVEAVFDSPRYYGEADVTVLPDQVVNADVTCTLSDVLVEPTFAEADFNANFKSWSLSVSNGTGSLVWNKAEGTLGKTGYFKPSGTLTWTLSLTNNANRTFTRSETYADVKGKQKYALNFKVATVDPNTGAAGLRIVLDDEMTERSFDLLLDFTSSEAEAKSVNAWALFADVKGSLKSTSVPAGLKLQYKMVGTEEWTDFTGEIKTDAENKSFTARLTGLTPGKNYVVRAKTDKEAGKKQIAFTTEAAAVLSNMSFDSWYMNGKAPMPDIQGEPLIWDTANPGSASLGTVPTNPESSHVAVPGEGKKAAKLESLAATMDIFAAGNIFTGKFGKAIASLSNPGATLDWGTPFYSRPLALKGYMDYRPVAITHAKSPYTELKGRPDTCQIQIFLTDRTTMYHIDTQKKQFVDINGSDVIAYGKLESGTVTSTKEGLVNGYEPFEIKLEYRDLTRKPNMIVIVAAASKYGDFFTGGKGTVLYLDEFSFVYDPAEL